MTRPIHRIVCATDFSESARIALDWASRFAQTLGADLHVVHAWQIPVLVGPAGAYLATAEVSGTLETDLATELEKACDGRPVAGRHLIRGSAEEAVRGVVESVGADLCVAGTTGGSALAHVVFGSVGERILRTATVPVVLVPKDFAPQLARGELVTRVMVPVEMGTDAEVVVAEALAVARRFHAKTDVVHVADLPQYVQRHASLANDTAAALGAELTGLLQRASGGDPEVQGHLELGSVETSLLEHVGKSAVDLVVMRTHGRGAVERFFVGSVTEKMVRKGGVPVLVLPAPA